MRFGPEHEVRLGYALLSPQMVLGIDYYAKRRRVGVIPSFTMRKQDFHIMVLSRDDFGEFRTSGSGNHSSSRSSDIGRWVCSGMESGQKNLPHLESVDFSRDPTVILCRGCGDRFAPPDHRRWTTILLAPRLVWQAA